jgi:oxygen-independent coproporphyrinogen III oxidase
MPGIYLHIPYCRQACTYCDFHFLTNLKQQRAMVEALKQEAALRREFFFPGQLLDTLYLGGGTPSVLTPEELTGLFAGLETHFSFAAGHERTLEANPDDLHPAYLQQLRALGVNRLSLGIQSFLPADLTRMNRSHTAAQALACVPAARAAGFDNFSLDLIFGLPGRRLDEWEANLQQAIDLRPVHLSLYALTVEPRTALAHQVKTGLLSLPEDESYEAQFLLAHDLLTAAGYDHYELSSYALPGYRSRHNGSYWTGEPYLGLGPSAHGFDGERRYWNAPQNHHYLQALRQGQLPPREIETLSPRDRYHEYVMTGLRTARGIALEQLQGWVPDWEAQFGAVAGRWVVQGWAIWENGWLRLSPAGWLRSDGLIAELFLAA